MENIVPDVPNVVNSVIRQTKTIPCQCKVCGAAARYSYFGAITCQSCKMFFKRHAQTKQTNSKCDYDQQCEININNRHKCPYCRLSKCFANGMRIEMIRCSRTKKNKMTQYKNLATDSIETTLVRRVKNYESKQLATLNLLRSDISTLHIDQWNLLSNLVHCFDEYNEYSFIEHFIRDQNTLPLKLRFKYSPVSDLFRLLMGKIQLVFEKNRDFGLLSLYDRSTLLRTTVEYTTTIGGLFALRQHQLFDYSLFYNCAETIFGRHAVALSKRIIDQLDPDNTFIKIMLAILAFSTINCTVYTKFGFSNLTNIKAMLPIQDMYTELAWKYLLYKYGHHQAVIRFSSLIRCLFLVNNAIAQANESKQYIEMVDYVIKETEQTLCL